MASVNEHMTSGRAWSQRSQVSQGFVKEVSNAINVAAVSEEQKRAYEMPGALDWLKSKDMEVGTVNAEELLACSEVETEISSVKLPKNSWEIHYQIR
jgi:hypothetical protein